MSHRPTRRREWQIQRFKSARRAYRLLPAHSRIHSYFRLRCHYLTANQYPAAWDLAFRAWRKVIGVSTAESDRCRLPPLCLDRVVNLTAPGSFFHAVSAKRDTLGQLSESCYDRPIDVRGGMDQYQAWVGNEPAGPARETWDEAAQDAVSAGLAAWVTDCISTAINWSITPAFISRTRRTGSANN